MTTLLEGCTTSSPGVFAPGVFATEPGGVLLEWCGPGARLGIEIDVNAVVTAYYYDHASSTEEVTLDNLDIPAAVELAKRYFGK